MTQCHNAARRTRDMDVELEEAPWKASGYKRWAIRNWRARQESNL
ncbi:MAG: hypothetical protein OEZ33_07855 [Gammaproteobacteria bacterium]|nr:hypothetical protein [Gammaproteobacteria bacterium]MDH5778109.1 hypothetical protein [Gammaproteobacteria bacterium]